jgi:DNA-binding transcriptional LysR family regulator
MNLPDLEAFVALAEMGSIKRAALHLGLTQPATTRRVQNFEARMGGVTLLDRSVKPAALTQAGRDVLNRCQRILRAVADLDDFASGKSTPIELRIGVSPGLAATVFSSPFDELRRRFASLQLRIKSQWTSEMIEAIQANALDCAVALVSEHHRLPSGIASAQIGIEPLAVVASRDLTLPALFRRSARLKDLGDAGWVLNPAGCGYREALVRACDRAGVACKIVADVLGYDLQLALVAKGAALGLVPRRLIDKSNLRRRLATVDVADFALDARIAVLRGPTLGRLGAAVDELQARLCGVIKHKNLA